MLAQRNNLVVGEGGVASVDVADHVGVSFEDHVFVDEAGAGNRRATGVNRALDTVFAGPRDHPASSRTVFHAAQADFAEEFHASGCEVFEVILDHALFEHGFAGVDFYASGAIRVEGALRENRHGFQPDNVFRAAGGVNFSGGDHG